MERFLTDSYFCQVAAGYASDFPLFCVDDGKFDFL